MTKNRGDKIIKRSLLKGKQWICVKINIDNTRNTRINEMHVGLIERLLWWFILHWENSKLLYIIKQH